jgi:hypothetical protein
MRLYLSDEISINSSDKTMNGVHWCLKPQKEIQGNKYGEAGRTSVQSLSGPNMTFVLKLWNAFNHPQYQNYSGVMNVYVLWPPEPAF